jgi:hypothetical protein
VVTCRSTTTATTTTNDEIFDCSCRSEDEVGWPDGRVGVHDVVSDERDAVATAADHVKFCD